MKIGKAELKDFLDYKANQYNTPDFITDDPISIPHRFKRKEDIEIAGLLVATISWGSRKGIVKSGNRMIDILGESPFDFVMSHNKTQLARFEGFVHRTFNVADLTYFIKALKHVYKAKGGMESIFHAHAEKESLQGAINQFKAIFFEIQHPERTLKHIGDPLKGSAAKKMNMYLRWMVRKDKRGVDFGIWKSIKPSQLSCPLDVHSGNVARKLGLLNRKQNDATALIELDLGLRELDKSDPVKYDFALFGLGVYENF
jgi:uncharacterized protein (TIGR02757 family)